MTKNKTLDEFDRKILRALQRNARLTTAELSETVGLSPSPCWTRLRNLEREGYVKEYVAVLDAAKLGYPDVVLIEVRLHHHDDEILERFGKALCEMPEVLEAYLTTGEYDYLVKVVVDGTSGYEDFLRRRLYRLSGIAHTRTSFALRCLKQTTSIGP